MTRKVKQELEPANDDSIPVTLGSFDLGMTATSFREAIIDRAATMLTKDADGYMRPRVEAIVRDATDKAVKHYITDVILPIVQENIDTVVMQETNTWGEKTGKQQTFRELLVARAEAYLREEVNHDGHSKGDSRASYWQRYGTRIAFMVHQHLHFQIEQAIKGAIEQGNRILVEGIADTVKMKLEEIKTALTINTKTHAK